MRHEPSLLSPSLATRQAGALGTVVAGPVDAGGIRWYRIDYEGSPDGWTSEANLEAAYFPPAESDGGWRELVGLNTAPSAAQRQSLQELAGVDWDKLRLAFSYSEGFGRPSDVLVIRNGYVVGEWGSRQPRGLASISKSLTGVTAAKLFDMSQQGDLPVLFGPAQPIARYLPSSWKSGNAARDRITVWDVMAMRSGLQPHDQPYADGYLTTVLNRPIVAPPMRQWAYASLPVDLLSIAITGASGMTVREAFNRHVGGPIGMAPIGWDTFGAYSRASAGASTSARDLARLGHLMLMRGRWRIDGSQRQLIGAARIDRLPNASTCSMPLNFTATAGSPFPIDATSPDYYGALWWSNRSGRALGTVVPRDAYYAHGYQEKLLVVVPSQNLIVVRNGSAPAALPEFRREFMARIMEAIEPLTTYLEPAVSSFALVNAESGQPIPGCETLKDGSTINLAFLPTRNVRMRASIAAAAADSVLFQTAANRTGWVDEEWPYLLPGGGNNGVWSPGVGKLTVRATAYADPGADGQRGGSSSVNIAIRNNPDAW